MKLAFTCGVMVLLACNGIAQIPLTKETIDLCGNWGRHAELSMQAHQEGFALADQLKLSPDPRAYELTMGAYEAPRLKGESERAEASAAYRDQITAECLRSQSGATAEDADRPLEYWQLQ